MLWDPLLQDLTRFLEDVPADRLAAHSVGNDYAWERMERKGVLDELATTPCGRAKLEAMAQMLEASFDRPSPIVSLIRRVIQRSGQPSAHTRELEPYGSQPTNYGAIIAPDWRPNHHAWPTAA